MMEEVFVYKTCPICYADYIPSKHNQRYCHDCRTYRKPEVEHYKQMQLEKERMENNEIYSKFPSINSIVSDLKEYNKKYGTNYTYGQYVMKLEHGWLKGET